MNKIALNVLVAGDYDKSERIHKYVDMIKQVYDKMSVTQGFSINEWRIVTKKTEVDEALRTEQYDVLICFTPLGIDKIGSGTMRTWREQQKHLRIMLYMEMSVRDGNPDKNIPPSKKPQLLYEHKFYDCFFVSDLTTQDLIDVTLKGRSAEEAYKYYKLGSTLEEHDVHMQPETEKEAPIKENLPVAAELSAKEDIVKKEIPVAAVDMPEGEETKIISAIDDTEASFDDDNEITNKKNLKEMPAANNDVIEFTEAAGEEDNMLPREEVTDTTFDTVPLQNYNRKQKPAEEIESENQQNSIGAFVQADIVYVCNEDTAVIKLRNPCEIDFTNPQLSGAIALIPYIRNTPKDGD